MDCFDEQYFLRGKQAGVSLYEDYRWLPDLTLPMVRAIVKHLGIKKDQTVLDFGCARGYVVRAFRELGYQADGIDVSTWAVENGDPSVREFLQVARMPEKSYDWVLAKDVLEHLTREDLDEQVPALFEKVRKGALVVVPLSNYYTGPYVVPEYEQDVTHVTRDTLEGWHGLLSGYATPRFTWRTSYLMSGVKDNWAYHPKGNGFLIGRRLY